MECPKLVGSSFPVLDRENILLSKVMKCVLPGCDGVAAAGNPYCCPKCASLDTGRKYATAEGHHFSNTIYFEMEPPPPLEGLFLFDNVEMQSSPILPSRKQPVSALHLQQSQQHQQQQKQQLDVKPSRREDRTTLTQLFLSRPEGRDGSGKKTARMLRDDDDDDDDEDDIISEENGVVPKVKCKSSRAVDGEDVWLTSGSSGTRKKSKTGTNRLVLVRPDEERSAKQRDEMLSMTARNSSATKQSKLSFTAKKK